MKSKFGFLLAVLFFVAALVTLPDYGLIWDAPTHYWKGQAYLRSILTGEENYQNLKVERRSFYQNDDYSLSYYLYEDSIGHPSLSDVLAAFSNYVFYQRLGIFGEVESHHLFIVFVCSLLVFVVFRFAQEVYGLFAALVASLSLVLYPLFLAESHFNVKDPVEASFYGLTIYAFYQGVVKKSWRWILVSSIFCSLALGTKFNVFFAGLTLLLWLIFYLGNKHQSWKKFFSRQMIIIFLLYPFIVLSIFILSSPRIRQDPLSNLLAFLKYYKEIGYGITYQPEEYLTVFGLNTYPFQWILSTTPLVILFFSGLGIIAALSRFKIEEKHSSLLILFWFLVPIIRVTLPKMGIYGGVRQIMEYIPAMAILAGLGAKTLRDKVKMELVKKGFKLSTINYQLSTIILLAFLPITFKMIQIHPNQNVYFNPLIGGLKGAQEKKIPAWGNSFGNVFRQGINWLNENAESEAKLTLAVSYEDAAPKIWLRDDIHYSNEYRSGLKREGEYVMEMTSDMDWPNFCYWAYVQNFLEPVYELKVDGGVILKIWKNDVAHTKLDFLEEEKLILLEGCDARDEPGQGQPDFSALDKIRQFSE